MRKLLQTLWLPLIFLVIPLESEAQNGWVAYSIPSPGGGSFHFVNSNVGLLTGKYMYHRTTNGGSSWSADSVPYPHNANDYNSVFFINNNTGWLGMSYHIFHFPIGLSGGAIYKTTNGGENWLPAVWTFSGVRAIKFVNESTGYAATGSIPKFHTEGAVYKTTNGGVNWETNGSAGYTVDVSFINANTGWAIGFSGSDIGPQIDIMIRTTNGGNNWTTLMQDTSVIFNALKRIQFADQNTGYLQRDKLYKSINGGNSWSLIDSLSRNFFFLNKDTGWVSRWNSNKIYRTNDGGNTWSMQNTPVSGISGSIQFINATTGWVVSNDTTILRTGTGGVTSIQPISSEVPGSFRLHQNYPNPFNPETKIKFEIPLSVRGQKSEVRLSVYDVSGKEVRMLVNSELAPGVYEYSFDGAGLGSGVYFYKLQTGDYNQTRRMVLVK